MYGSTTQLPNRMLTYTDALAKYHSIKPIRGRQDQNTRPLARRSNDNLTIRQEECSGDIVVCLYSTDIVRYREREGDGYNNLIELKPYASVLTNRVVWSILGPKVNTYWSDRHHSTPDHVTQVGGRYYNTPNYALIQPQDGDYQLVGGSKPFEVPSLNRKEAKQALRDANYYTFQTWLNTLIRLDLDPRSESWRRQPFDHSPSSAYKYLTAGEDGWRELAGRMSRICDLKRELESLRTAIYKYDMCYDTDVIPYFENHNDMTNALNRMRRNG